MNIGPSAPENSKLSNLDAQVRLIVDSAFFIAFPRNTEEKHFDPLGIVVT